MSVAAALVAGAAIGGSHALEADHVAAVATLVDDESTDHAGVVGTSWGVGHAIPIAVVALAFLFAGTRLPDWVTGLFELFAGVILVYLGARMLYRLVDVTEHTHDGDTHSHVHVGPLSIGMTHSHGRNDSFLVGIVHGLAGSGASIVGLVAAAPTLTSGVALLAAFCGASIVAMGTLSLLWGRILDTGARRALQGVAGAASLVIGALLIAGELFDDVGHGHSHGAGGADHEHAMLALDAATDAVLAAADLVVAAL